MPEGITERGFADVVRRVVARSDPGMIHLHGNPGMNYVVVLLPDFIRTVAGMHDDRFAAIHQGGGWYPRRARNLPC